MKGPPYSGIEASAELEAAFEQAYRDGDGRSPVLEDVLAALLGQESVVQCFGYDPAAAEATISALLANAPEPDPQLGDSRLSRAMTWSFEIAARDDRRRISPSDLLVALAGAIPEIGRVLADIGIVPPGEVGADAYREWYDALSSRPRPRVFEKMVEPLIGRTIAAAVDEDGALRFEFEDGSAAWVRYSGWRVQRGSEPAEIDALAGGVISAYEESESGGAGRPEIVMRIRIGDELEVVVPTGDGGSLQWSASGEQAVRDTVNSSTKIPR